MTNALIVISIASVALNLFLWIRWQHTTRLLDEATIGREKFIERIEKRRERI